MPVSVVYSVLLFPVLNNRNNGIRYTLLFPSWEYWFYITPSVKEIFG